MKDDLQTILLQVESECKATRTRGLQVLSNYLEDHGPELEQDPVVYEAYSAVLHSLIKSCQRELQYVKTRKNAKTQIESYKLIRSFARLTTLNRHTSSLHRFTLLWQPDCFNELVEILREPMEQDARDYLFRAITLWAPFFRHVPGHVIERLMDSVGAQDADGNVFFDCALSVLSHFEIVSQNFVKHVGKTIFQMTSLPTLTWQLTSRWPLTLTPDLDLLLNISTRPKAEKIFKTVLTLACCWANAPSPQARQLSDISERLVRNSPERYSPEFSWILELTNSGRPKPVVIIERLMNEDRGSLRIVPEDEVIQTLREDWPEIEDAGFDFNKVLTRLLKKNYWQHGGGYHTISTDTIALERIQEIRRMFCLDVVSQPRRKFINKLPKTLISMGRDAVSLKFYLKLCLGGTEEIVKNAIHLFKTRLPKVTGSSHTMSVNMPTQELILLCKLECPNIEALLTPVALKLEEGVKKDGDELLTDSGYLHLATRISFHPDGVPRIQRLWEAVNDTDIGAKHLAEALTCYGEPSDIHFNLVAGKLHQIKGVADSMRWLPFLRASSTVFHGKDHQGVEEWLNLAIDAAGNGTLGSEAKIALCEFFVVVVDRSEKGGEHKLRETARTGIAEVGRDAILFDENPEVNLRCAQLVLKCMMREVVEDQEMVIGAIADTLGPPFGEQEWTLARFGLCIEYVLAVDGKRRPAIIANMLHAAEQCDQWPLFEIALNALCKRFSTTLDVMLKPMQLYLVGHWASMGASIESFPFAKFNLEPTVKLAKALALAIPEDADFIYTVGAKVHKARGSFPDFDRQLKTHAHDCIAVAVTLAMQPLHPDLSDSLSLKELPSAWEELLQNMAFEKFLGLHFKYVIEWVDEVLKVPDPLGVMPSVGIDKWLSKYVGKSETNLRVFASFCKRHKFPMPELETQPLEMSANGDTVLSFYDRDDVVNMMKLWPEDWPTRSIYTDSLQGFLKDKFHDVEQISSVLLSNGPGKKRRKVAEDAEFLLEKVNADNLHEIAERMSVADFTKLYAKRRCASSISIAEPIREIFLGHSINKDERWFAWCLWQLNGSCLTNDDRRIRRAAVQCLGGLMQNKKQVKEGIAWWKTTGRPMLDVNISSSWFGGIAPAFESDPFQGKRPPPVDWSGWDKEGWICRLVSDLLKRDYRKFLVPLASVDPGFAEAVFPFVFDCRWDAKPLIEVLTQSSTECPNICRTLLNMLHHVRLDHLMSKTTENNRAKATAWTSELDLLAIAEACLKVEELVEALIYIEAYLHLSHGSLLNHQRGVFLTLRAHRLLQEPADHPFLVGGAGEKLKTIPNAAQEVKEQRLEEAIQSQNVLTALSLAAPTDFVDVCRRLGLHKLVNYMVHSPPSTTEASTSTNANANANQLAIGERSQSSGHGSLKDELAFREAKAEARWRLEDWTPLREKLEVLENSASSSLLQQPSPSVLVEFASYGSSGSNTTSSNILEGFHSKLHRSLCEPVERVQARHRLADDALKCAYDDFNAQLVDPLTTAVRFCMAHEIKRVKNVDVWTQESQINNPLVSKDERSKFEAWEPRLLVRYVLERQLQDTSGCALPYARLCRKAHRFDQALHLISRATPKSLDLEWEEAQCLWALNDKHRAILIARDVVNVTLGRGGGQPSNSSSTHHPHDNNNTNDNNPHIRPSDRAKRCGRLAQWNAEVGGGDAVNLFKQMKPYGKDYPKALFWLATFFDSQFLRIVENHGEQAVADELMQKEITEGKVLLSKKRDLMMSKDVHNTEQELHARKARFWDCLSETVDAYGECLKTPMRKRMTVVASRFLTLWFNYPDALNEKIKKLLTTAGGSISVKHFLPFFPQIVGRMSNPAGENAFQKLLRYLVMKMILEFPLDTVYATVCLLNQKQVNKETFGGRQGANYVADKKKEEAAKHVLTEVGRKGGPKIQKIINAVRHVSHFYHNLADGNGTAQGKQPSNMDLPLSGVVGYEHAKEFAKELPPMTAPSSNALVASFPSTYRQVGTGISQPSILEVRDERGVKHKQLVKGRDDLRQDMIVQQLFEQVNTVFADNNDAHRLRTYKVVPLSPSSGVCEWVQSAVSLGDAINKLQERYYPHDWPRIQCIRHMQALVAVQNRVPLERKKAGFEEILRNTHPVLHLFFFENFPDPQRWFTAKQTYRKSLAVSSMVGYIIGLGDRHLQNILIDPTSGEVVHIDFGMTFDYGKSHQNISELVPFRLTRDLQNALGPMGIDHGGFRKSCEESMLILQKHAEIVSSIVEVFAYDPMVRWCNVVRTQENSQAKLAVMGVRRKLQGFDEGSAAPLDVSGLVRRLLNRATDNSLLCQMFQGWAPWC